MNAKQVLIVDDEETIRVLFQRCFESIKPHCRVVTAKSGPEALAHLELQSFDLAVVDYRMPGMNGLEFIRSARKILPEMQIILTSGSYPGEINRTNGQQTFDGFLDKPFTLNQFLAMLDRLDHSQRQIPD